MIIDFSDCPEQTLNADEQKIKTQLLDQAADLGPLAVAFIQSLWTESILGAAEQARGLFSLAHCHETKRLEAACKRALFYQRPDYLTVDKILRENLDSLPLNPYTDVNGRLMPWPPTTRILF
jgi:hypothetical protein